MSQKNTPASVWARLRLVAKKRGEQPEYTLTRYALERLLYRLSQSAHANQFILKGACLFEIWSQHPHRATRDIDFLGFGANNIDHLVAVFKEICQVPVEDDGLDFKQDTTTGKRIRENQTYEGIGISMKAVLGQAIAHLQIDIGFGDIVTPAAKKMKYPTMLKQSAPLIHVYPKETAIAEKFQAMVHLGRRNSRMKDFFDVYMMTKLFDFSGAILFNAIVATFSRRGTLVPNNIPTALTDEFALDKNRLWSAFLQRIQLEPLAFNKVQQRFKPFFFR